ncbi:hypothetical protein ACLMJK_000847 [Lecanora helva]
MPLYERLSESLLKIECLATASTNDRKHMTFDIDLALLDLLRFSNNALASKKLLPVLQQLPIETQWTLAAKPPLWNTSRPRICPVNMLTSRLGMSFQRSRKQGSHQIDFPRLKTSSQKKLQRNEKLSSESRLRPQTISKGNRAAHHMTVSAQTTTILSFSGDAKADAKAHAYVPKPSRRA